MTTQLGERPNINMSIRLILLLLVLVPLVSCASRPIRLIKMEDASCVELNGFGVPHRAEVVERAITDAEAAGVGLAFYKANPSADGLHLDYSFFIVGPRRMDDVYWVYTADRSGKIVHKFQYSSLHQPCRRTNAASGNSIRPDLLRRPAYSRS